MSKRLTQKSQVLAYLSNYGPITAMKAQNEFGCWRLSSVIQRLRQDGHKISTLNRVAFNGNKFAEYRLVS